MRILFVGDICGRPGRRIASQLIPKIKEKREIDFVIANGENAAGGFGITKKIVHKLISYKIDCITSGNHVWDKEEIIDYLRGNPKNLLIPANYPEKVPGLGFFFYPQGIGVINLLGRSFVDGPVNCPFRIGDEVIKYLRAYTKIILIDFHAELTQEKKAIGWYFDGKVSAIVGTHTHVQTADETILPGGTAYITDVGMTGAFDSVIGVKKEKSIDWLLKGIPTRFDAAQEDIKLNGVIIDIDGSTGKSVSIERISSALEI